MFCVQTLQTWLLQAAIQGPTFISYSNWWQWQQGVEKITQWHRESMFSEGLCNEDTTNEHIYKQVIPEYPFLHLFSLLVQASLQAFSMACFPRPSVGACVWTFTEWQGVKRTGDLFLCLRGVEQIKEQNPAQHSRSIHTSPRCSVRADALLDNLPSSQLLPVKPGQHLHSSVVTVR